MLEVGIGKGERKTPGGPASGGANIFMSLASRNPPGSHSKDEKKKNSPVYGKERGKVAILKYVQIILFLTKLIIKGNYFT